MPEPQTNDDMKTQAVSTLCLNLRLSSADYEKIERATIVKGLTVADFAACVLRRRFETPSRSRLSDCDCEVFLKMLDADDESNDSLLVLVPMFLINRSFDSGFEQAIPILVISCPNALVMSTPVSIGFLTFFDKISIFAF